MRQLFRAAALLCSFIPVAFARTELPAQIPLPDTVARTPALAAIYRFVGAHLALTDRLPCFCGCRHNGHRSLSDCFVEHRGKQQQPLRWNEHAIQCGLCLGLAQEAERLAGLGLTPADIRQRLEQTYDSEDDAPVQTAPPYEAQTSDGGRVSLRDFKGQPVVLMFLHTECPHCGRTVRRLWSLLPARQKDGLHVIVAAINGSDRDKVGGFLDRYHLNAPLALDDVAHFRAYIALAPDGVYYLPTLVFINREGNIARQVDGRDPRLNRDEDLAALLDDISSGPVTRER
jgi:peroxiredoxin